MWFSFFEFRQSEIKNPKSEIKKRCYNKNQGH